MGQAVLSRLAVDWPLQASYPLGPPYLQCDVCMQVHRALEALACPRALEIAFVLSSHTVLSLTAPIYGPVLESLSRMLALAVDMFEAAGLISRPGSAQHVLSRADSSMSQLKRDPLRLQKQEAKFKAALSEGRRRLAAGKHVLSAAVESGMVGAVELAMDDALKPVMAELQATICHEVLCHLKQEVVAQVASLAVDAALPLVGAAYTALHMPEAYEALARSVSRSACRQHEAWLLAHWHERSGTPALSNASSTRLEGGCAALADQQSRGLSDSVESLVQGASACS